LKGRFFSISFAKAKSLAAGVFLGGVLLWSPLPFAEMLWFIFPFSCAHLAKSCLFCPYLGQ